MSFSRGAPIPFRSLNFYLVKRFQGTFMSLPEMGLGLGLATSPCVLLYIGYYFII